MTEKRSRVFLGQLTERTGSYGKFWSGRIGMAQMIVSPGKDPTKVNVYLEETQQPEQAKASQQGHHDAHADDGGWVKDTYHGAFAMRQVKATVPPDDEVAF